MSAADPDHLADNDPAPTPADGHAASASNGHVPADEAVDQWLERARVQMSRAHAAYSGFAVGAVVVSADGNSYDGVNVENVSYSLTMCAERVAIGSMVAAGDRSGIVLVAVAGPGDEPLTPCGSCRQVIAEFAEPDALVVSRDRSGRVARWTVAELLPAAFDAVRLENGQAAAPDGDPAGPAPAPVSGPVGDDVSDRVDEVPA